MDFTALHRLLGRPPGPLTDEMLDAAVSSRLAETDDLDWKRQLPEERNLAQSDLVKDIAAMANSGGGLIVFGVDEDQKHARGRTDVGPVSESFERTLRRVAVSGIQPPVFNLLVHRLGPESNRALVVGVPPSVDAPHLIYRGEYFGAAVRNNADTEWLRERQLESLYRARLDERRNAGHALTQLYLEIAAGRDAEVRAWFIAVARPRVPTFTRRLTRDHARSILGNSGDFALSLDRGGRRPMLPVHPLQSVDVNNPRVGLRRWIAPNTAVGAGSQCYETWASIHDDGSATLAAAVGGGRTRDGHDPANRIDSQRLEACVAGVLALARQASEEMGVGNYELRIGIEWAGQDPLTVHTVDQFGYPYDGDSIPLTAYIPYVASIQMDLDPAAYVTQVREIATDVINQGGIQNLRLLGA